MGAERKWTTGHIVYTRGKGGLDKVFVQGYHRYNGYSACQITIDLSNHELDERLVFRKLLQCPWISWTGVKDLIELALYYYDHTSRRRGGGERRDDHHGH